MQCFRITHINFYWDITTHGGCFVAFPLTIDHAFYCAAITGSVTTNNILECCSAYKHVILGDGDVFIHFDQITWMGAITLIVSMSPSHSLIHTRYRGRRLGFDNQTHRNAPFKLSVPVPDVLPVYCTGTYRNSKFFGDLVVGTTRTAVALLSRHAPWTVGFVS